MHEDAASPAPQSALSEDEAWALLDGLRRVDGVRAVTVLPDPSGTALRVDLILDARASRAHAASEAARVASDRVRAFVAVFVEGGTDAVGPSVLREPVAPPRPEPAVAHDTTTAVPVTPQLDEGAEVDADEDLMPVGSGRIAFDDPPRAAPSVPSGQGAVSTERRRRPRALLLEQVHVGPGESGAEQAVVTLRHREGIGVGTAPGVEAASVAAATLQAIRVIVDAAVGAEAAADLVDAVEVVQAEHEHAPDAGGERWEGRTLLGRLGGGRLARGRARDRRRPDAVARSTLDATNRAIGDLLPE